MRRTRQLRVVALLTAVVALPVLGQFTAVQASAQPFTTTTVATTTTAPPTTTTSTTLLPTTTTTTTPATTTTQKTTTTKPTTTTTTAATSSSSSTPWGWILLALVIVLAIVLVALLIARNRRLGREATWGRSVLPALTAAELARELVLTQSADDEAQRRASVGIQVDEAVSALERAAASAPSEDERALCTRCAESLRGLAFAVEADHLLRSGGGHPTGDQLAATDAARRHRAAELDAALTQLRAVAAPPSPGATPQA